MTFSDIAKRVQKLTIDNSPLILTGIGIAGTVTTAYLTGKASFKAADVLRMQEQQISLNKTGQVDSPFEIPFKQKVNLVWQCYIPAALAGTATIAAIIGANQIGTRRTAALAAAYSLSEKAFTEYREKVVDRVGKQKEQSIRDDLAQDRVNANPIGNREIIIAGSGEVDCYEAMTGRYFKSSMEELKAAQNALNYQLNNDGYASLSEFYDKIGLPRTSMSEEVGWTSDKLMELSFSTVLSDKGTPCIAIDYHVEPVRDFFRFGGWH